MNIFSRLIVVLFFVVFIFSDNILALDRNKCAAMVNNGWYKRYQFQGPYFHGVTASSNASSQRGIGGTSDYYTEFYFTLYDPGYTSNTSWSQTQSTTSTGECSLFADYIREQRIHAIVVNSINELKIDIANGGGPYTKAIAEISMCESEQDQFVAGVLRDNYASIFSEDKKIAFKIASELKGYGRCLSLFTKS